MVEGLGVVVAQVVLQEVLFIFNMFRVKGFV